MANLAYKNQTDLDAYLPSEFRSLMKQLRARYTEITAEYRALTYDGHAFRPHHTKEELQ